MADTLDLGILVPAFIAGLLILATHVPLGHEVLKRGIIFIDLAIAQITGLGIIFASRMGFETHGWEVQLAAIGSALLAAWGLSLLEKYHPQMQEAEIGVSFILAATASILLLANHPHGGEQLQEMLVGQILWITWSDLLHVVLATLFILGVWFQLKSYRKVGFYFLFALAVTCSVQLVGVYLVFASLIIPALGSRKHEGKKALLIAYLIGVLGYGLGLIVSSIADLPSGAVIVWSISAMSLLFYLFTKKSDQMA
ncbi:MAG: metal ABC transporter permease [Nitrospirota bacterium]